MHHPYLLLIVVVMLLIVPAAAVEYDNTLTVFFDGYADSSLVTAYPAEVQSSSFCSAVPSGLGRSSIPEEHG